MFRFLHVADVHIDSPLKGLANYPGAPVEECRRATRHAFENVVKTAITERVAFVVIAGDLYDGDWQDYNTGLFFIAQMARLAEYGIKVYLVRGNHDAANKMTRSLRLPEHVRLFDSSKPETAYDAELGVAIHGQSFATRAVLDNLARSYPARVSGYFNLGVLHTCLSGREGHESYAPCSLDDLRQRGYDYWALGHVHECEIVSRGDPWIVFPGNTQGRHAREIGAKYCALVAVNDQHQCSVELREVDVARWESIEVDLADAFDLDQALARTETILHKLVERVDRELILVRITFTGQSQAHSDLLARSAQWLEQVRSTAITASSGRIWVEKIMARTTSVAQAYSEDEGAFAAIDRFLEELQQDEQTRDHFLATNLADVRDRLGSELTSLLNDPTRRIDLLAQIGPLLRDRLTNSRRAGPGRNA